MIVVDQLSKRFGEFNAVDKVSFEVNKGEVLGFLGPNGAGKSTTMKMLTGFMKPTSGTASVCGFDIIKETMSVKQSIGYLPESAATYGEMRVSEFLKFAGNVRGFSGLQLSQAVDKALEKTALGNVKNQLIETLSKGYKQRVALAQCLLHEPPVMILDEPTDGLDPNQKHEARKLIKSLQEDRTIIISTHILEEVEAVCTKAVIIAGGKVVADSSPKELLRQSKYFNSVHLRLITEKSDDFVKNLSLISTVEAIEINEQSNELLDIVLLPKNKENIYKDVESFLHTKKTTIDSFHTDKGRLDEVFRSITLT